MLFVPANSPTGFRIIEDAFVVMLEPAQWRRLREALAGGLPLRLPLASGTLEREQIRQTISSARRT